MTIEELTFAAFQQGREQGREESAAQIERLRVAAERALHILQYCPDKQEKAVALLSAALQPKEGEE